MLKKLTSRKFITAIIGVAIGIAMIFGVDEETAVSVAGAILALVSVVSYIVIEGKVDREAVSLTLNNIEDISQKLLEKGAEEMEK